MSYLSRVSVADQSYVSAARRAAVGLAERLGYTETAAGNVAIIATELATNLVKHAGGGEIIARALEDSSSVVLEILALDQGGGMSNVAECMRDGYSTAGSSGTGLGALTRLSGKFDFYTQPGRGTVASVRIWPDGRATGSPQSLLDVDGLSIPKHGESACGDGWSVQHSPSGCSVAVVDGLGHGPLAADAARTALDSFQQVQGLSPAEFLERMHGALRSTRGAAGAVAEIDVPARQVRFAGVGNIAASIVAGLDVRHLVSMNGTLGHEARFFREFSYDWQPFATLILHSDGIATRWDLSTYPGIGIKPLSVIAGVLYRDLNRGRDDATVVIARERGGR
jgi:anti-sigma regulatory factor (Ser/Thr protein kinase)